MKNNSLTRAESKNTFLNLFLNKLDQEIISLGTNNKQIKGDNITKAERAAIKSLNNNNKDIVINKADRGSTIVVLNKCNYIEEGLKNPDEPKVYKQLKADTTAFIRIYIMKFLVELRFQKWMPMEFVDFCTPSVQFRTSQLYFLKKILKNPMGIRPNVSSLNSITENISSFVDYWLQLLVKQLPSYLKHTKELVDLITTTQIPLNSTLVSIDVSSLYTNIPHKDGITSSVNALKWDQNPHPLRPPIEFWRKC